MEAKTVEERLTVVEHQVGENAHRFEELREAIRELGNRMDRRFEAMDRRFEAMEQRFDRRFLWLTGDACCDDVGGRQRSHRRPAPRLNASPAGARCGSS